MCVCLFNSLALCVSAHVCVVHGMKTEIVALHCAILCFYLLEYS